MIYTKSNHFYRIFLFLLYSINIIIAGTSGKIVGRVIDSQTGDPLIGCNIIIIGTSMGAATDVNGEFLILNVSPGVYDIRAMMIGYTAVTMKNVDVIVDLTTTADFTMSMEVIGGEEVIVIAQKPTVRLDQTSMASVMNSSQIDNLPVNEVSELIELQAGVVKDPDGGLHVRGGRSGEVSFWVDGISVTDAYDASMGLEIENNAVQELQVISGTFNAEYGNAMSGIVNIVTKDGGEKITGGIDVYGGGYHTFDKKLFSLSSPWQRWKPYEDRNENGKWDRGEWWEDYNGNLTWDPNEPFADDNGDGIWQEGEPINNDVGYDGQPGDPMDNGSQVPSLYSDNDGIRNEASNGEGDGEKQWGEHQFSPDKRGYIDKLNIFQNPLQLKNFQLHLSGPVPLIGKKLTFYTNYRYFNTLNWYYGKRLFTPVGVFGDEKIVPMAPFAKMTGQLKLTYKPVSIMKFSYSVYYDEKEYNSYNSFFKYNPDGVLNKYEQDLSHILSFTHTLSPNTFYELKFIDFSTSYWEYLYKDENDVPFPDKTVEVKPSQTDSVTISTTSGDLKLPTNYIVDSTYGVNTKGDSVWYYTYLNLRDSEGYVDPVIMTTPGWSFGLGGTEGGRFERNTSYNMIKFDLSSQINKHNQAKIGLEIKKFDLWVDEKSIQYETTGSWGITTNGDTIGYNPLSGSRVQPYTPTIVPTYSSDHNYYRKKPLQIAAYIQDKLEIDDLIINLGIRLDYFVPDGVVPKDDRFPSNRKYYLANTARDTVVFWEYDYPELSNGVTIIDSLNAEGAVKAGNLISKGITGETEWQDVRSNYIWSNGYKDVPASYQISPRVGLSYPITDKGAIHVSYGHFFQIPNFSLLYENPEFEVEKSENFQDDRIVGNSALKPERTVMYEVGLKQEVALFTALDFTLFYRDTRDWVGISAPISKYPVGNYFKYENRDYANTRGFTISLNRNYVQGIGASVYYSWMVAEGSYSNPTDAFFTAKDNNAPQISLVPLDWDQTHTLNATVTFGGQSWNVSFIGAYWSGKPYTPEFKVGAISGSSAFSGFAENSDRRPSYANVDLRSSYRLKLMGVKATLYLNIFNLLDIKNEQTVWGDTGRATYTLIAKDVSETDISRIGTLQEQINKPDWYTEPRKFNIGLSMSF